MASNRNTNLNCSKYLGSCTNDLKCLPCLHIYCARCLEDEYLRVTHEGSSEISCSICGSTSNVDIGSLPNASILSSALSDDQDVGNDRLCDSCKEDSKEVTSSVYCLDCQLSLCERCLRTHRRLLKSHKVQPIGTDTTVFRENDVTKFLKKCPNHNSKKVEYFCKDDNTFCCSTCLILYHKHHNICDIDAMPSNTNFNEMQQVLASNLRQLKSKLCDMTTSAQDKRKSLNSDIACIKQKIHGFRQRLNQLLDAFEQQVMHDGAIKTGLATTELEAQEDRCRQISSAINNSVIILDAASRYQPFDATTITYKLIKQLDCYSQLVKVVEGQSAGASLKLEIDDYSAHFLSWNRPLVGKVVIERTLPADFKSESSVNNQSFPEKSVESRNGNPGRSCVQLPQWSLPDQDHGFSGLTFYYESQEISMIEKEKQQTKQEKTRPSVLDRNLITVGRVEESAWPLHGPKGAMVKELEKQVSKREENRQPDPQYSQFGDQSTRSKDEESTWSSQMQPLAPAPAPAPAPVPAPAARRTFAEVIKQNLGNASAPAPVCSGGTTVTTLPSRLRAPKEKDQSRDGEGTTKEMLVKAADILCKLSPSNINSVVKDLTNLQITTKNKLRKFVELILHEALKNIDSTLCTQYAVLCYKLSALTVQAAAYMGIEQLECCSFKEMLIARCQQLLTAFWTEGSPLRPEPAVGHEVVLHSSATDSRYRNLQILRFLGEILKFKMVRVATIQDCIDKLIPLKDEVVLECICKLFQRAGNEMRTSKGNARLEGHLYDLKSIAESGQVSERTQWMIEDITGVREVIYNELSTIMENLQPDTVQDSFSKMRNLPIRTEVRLCDLVHLMFEKAYLQPDCTEICVRLCQRMSPVVKKVVIDPASGVEMSIHGVLLQKCLHEFRAWKPLSNRLNTSSSESEDPQCKRRSLTGLRMLTELLAARMIKKQILLECVEKLQSVKDQEVCDCLQFIYTRLGNILPPKTGVTSQVPQTPSVNPSPVRPMHNIPAVFLTQQVKQMPVSSGSSSPKSVVTDSPRPSLPSSLQSLNAVDTPDTYLGEDVDDKNSDDRRSVANQPPQDLDRSPAVLTRMMNFYEKLIDIPKLCYAEGQWSPSQTSGKKWYSREFLLQLQFVPSALRKPLDFLDVPDVTFDTPIYTPKFRQRGRSDSLSDAGLVQQTKTDLPKGSTDLVERMMMAEDWSEVNQPNVESGDEHIGYWYIKPKS